MANTNDYKNLFKQSGVPKRLLVSFPRLSVTLRNEDIVAESMEISESLCSGTELRFGSCEASVFKLRVIGNVIPLFGETCVVSMQIGENEPYALGTYKVASDKPTADRRYRDIVAYDAMDDIINAEMAEWYYSVLPEVDSTTTLRAFRESFISHFGLEQEEITLPNDEMVVERTLDAEELSGKDILSAICEINGCFGHIGRNGKMQYVTLEEIESGLSPANDLFPVDNVFPYDGNTEKIKEHYYTSCRYEDYTTKRIGKLQIRQEENDVGAIVGEGENCYIVQDNFLVYGKDSTALTAVAQNLFDVINVVNYRPASVQAIGNPCLEVGTKIRLNTQHEVVETYILERTLKGIHGLIDNYESQGTETYSENVNSVQKSIVKLKGKMNLLTRTVDETTSELRDVEADLSSRISQTANSISAEVRRAQSAEASLSIRADQISTSVSNLETNLSSRITQNADSISAEVTRATAAEAALRISTDEIELSVANLEEYVQSEISVLEGEIQLRTTAGMVSSMISVALDGITLSAAQVNINGNTTINDVLTIDTGGNLELKRPNSVSYLTINNTGVSVSNGAYHTDITGGSIRLWTPLLSQNVNIASFDGSIIQIGDRRSTAGTGSNAFVKVLCSSLDSSSADITTINCTTINGEAPITRAEHQSLINRILALEGFIPG
jgi:hypothetical protein